MCGRVPRHCSTTSIWCRARVWSRCWRWPSKAGLSELVAERVGLGATRVVSAGVNPAGKVSAIIAGMAASADCIDDLQVIRSGGMKQLFAEVYAPATLGQFLREFSHQIDH
jgi:hypothetical protein